MRKPRNNLMYYRMKSIMSQQDVAEALGLSQSYYGKLERHPENINVGMMLELKKLFNAGSIDELVSDVV